jgi:tetratricopeptide (TPR) repeat protein
LNEADRALEAVTRALEYDPGNLAALRRVIQVRQVLGDDPGVDSDCDKLEGIVLSSRDDLPVLEFGGALGGLCNRWDQALVAAERIVNRFPRWYRGYYGRAVTLTLLGRYEEALPDFDKTIELAPRWFQGFRSRAVLHERVNQIGEAVADAQRAVECNPYDAPNRATLSIYLFKLGQQEEALTELNRSIELDPAHLGSYAERGQQHAHLGRCEEARDDFLRAEEGARAEGRVWALGNLAVCRCLAAFRCPETYAAESVLADLRAAHERFPGEIGLLLDSQGVALYHAGRYKEAQEVLMVAVKDRGGPAATLHYLVLSMTALRLGDRTTANSYFSRGVELMEQHAPHNPALKDVRREAARLLGVEDEQGTR